MLKEELREFLFSHNVPLDQWGKGAAKTLEHLCAEISSRESGLEEKNGALLRLAEGSTLNVYYNDRKNILRLVEARQIFKDGRIKVRELETSIGEKMRHGEDPRVAAYRALSEELGIFEKLFLIPVAPIKKGPIPSVSFPGILSVYMMHVFDVFIPPHLYKAEGYQEHQEDKSSYFVWQKT